MTKIIRKKLICACCGEEVTINRIISYKSESAGLNGNKHSKIQYITEKCPECKYVALNIEKDKPKIRKKFETLYDATSSFKKMNNTVLDDLLNAAKNYAIAKNYQNAALCYRKASFLLEELDEIPSSKLMLDTSRSYLVLFFSSLNVLTHETLPFVLYLIDDNRRLGESRESISLANEIKNVLENIDDDEVKRLIKLVDYEIKLNKEGDTEEHFINDLL